MDRIHFMNWLRELVSHSLRRIWIPCPITKMATNFKNSFKARDHLAAQTPTISPKITSSTASTELKAKWRARILPPSEIIITALRTRPSSFWFKCKTPANRWTSHTNGQAWWRQRAIKEWIPATTRYSKIQVKTYFWMKKRTTTTKTWFTNNTINLRTETITNSNNSNWQCWTSSLYLNNKSNSRRDRCH